MQTTDIGKLPPAPANHFREVMTLAENEGGDELPGWDGCWGWGRICGSICLGIGS